MTNSVAVKAGHALDSLVSNLSQISVGVFRLIVYVRDTRPKDRIDEARV